MPKDYVGERTNKILMPGDPGFNNPQTPWGGIRNIFGWQKPEAFRLYISGFYLIDRRMKPSIAIFKNMAVVGNQKPESREEPIPFESLDEAMYYKNKMNLTADDSLKVSFVALAPDPGIGNARPNVLWVDKKHSKRM
jgi:hypothetical protein